VAYELGVAGLRFRRQQTVPIVYKGTRLDWHYRLDFVIEDRVVLELKCVQALTPVHAAQVISYLRLAGLPVALLVNFHAPTIREGLKRFANAPR
jgi:GxxExxY protein